VSKHEVLAGITNGSPSGGPRTAHVDVTHACNAACIACRDQWLLPVERDCSLGALHARPDEAGT